MPADQQQALLDHYERFFGPPGPILFCDLTPSPAHIDAYVYPASADRPWLTLATVGMSTLPMPAKQNQQTHDGASAEGGDSHDPAHHSRLELVMYLDADWDFDSAVGQYPLSVLHGVARFPFEADTALDPGDTISGFDRPLLPGSLLTATYLRRTPEDTEFEHLNLPGGHACHFCWVVPVTDAELYVIKNDGRAAYHKLLYDHEYLTLDPDRACFASSESRIERRARQRAQKKRAKLPRLRTVGQLECQMHGHAS